jgi:hypothetical protein
VCLLYWSTRQQPEQPLDVESQGGDAFGDRPDLIEPEGIDGQAAEGGQDLDNVVLAVAVSVYPQRHIPHPMPPVLDWPALLCGID